MRARSQLGDRGGRDLTGALAGACGDDTVGAYLGEAWKGRPHEARVAAGRGAFTGRIWGTVGKLAVGAIMLVVVVLPCVPATATVLFSRISSASISARRTTGIRFSSAQATSGLVRLTAVEVTTTPAPATFPAA